MEHPRGFMLPTVAIALGCVVTGCSSGQDKTSQGSLSLMLAASRPFSSADPLPQLVAAKVTVSAIEARKSDGSWASSESDPPTEFDLVALNASGVALAPYLLPEGQYSALQLHFSRVELTLNDGTQVSLASPATGWVVLIPADFGVASDRVTFVALSVQPGASFEFGGGHFEFEPEMAFDGVLRNERVFTPTTGRGVSP